MNNRNKCSTEIKILLSRAFKTAWNERIFSFCGNTVWCTLRYIPDIVLQLSGRSRGGRAGRASDKKTAPHPWSGSATATSVQSTSKFHFVKVITSGGLEIPNFAVIEWTLPWFANRGNRHIVFFPAAQMKRTTCATSVQLYRVPVALLTR